MNEKYIGTICEICGEPLKESDEIAICPECGTPYHRSCIREAKHCVHEEEHAIGYQWSDKNPQVDVKEEIFCPNCGIKNNASGNFCTACGYPLKGQQPQFQSNRFDANRFDANPYGAGQFDEDKTEESEQENPFMGGPQMRTFRIDPYAGIAPDEQIIDDVTAKEAAAYVRKNPTYFLPRFKAMKNRAVAVNFSALLFGGLYYIYRKVYGIGFLLLLVQVMLSIPAFILGLNYAFEFMKMSLPFTLDVGMLSGLDTTFSILRIVIMIISGFFFNRIYRNQTAQKVRKVRALHLDKQQTLMELSRRGGVNFAIIVVLLVSYFAFYYAIVMSFMQVFL